jgi:hypothetical protein
LIQSPFLHSKKKREKNRFILFFEQIVLTDDNMQNISNDRNSKLFEINYGTICETSRTKWRQDRGQLGLIEEVPGRHSILLWTLLSRCLALWVHFVGS